MSLLSCVESRRESDETREPQASGSALKRHVRLSGALTSHSQHRAHSGPAEQRCSLNDERVSRLSQTRYRLERGAPPPSGSGTGTAKTNRYKTTVMKHILSVTIFSYIELPPPVSR